MKKIVALLIVISLFGFINLNEEVNFEKVNYSVNGNQSYSVGTDIDDGAEYIDKVVVRVELDYEVEKVERDKTASTLKAVNSEKNRVRLELKEQHSRENNRLFENIDVDYYQSYYICSYSPHIEYEYYKNDFLLHKDEILSKLNSNPNIVSISVEEYKDRITDYVSYAMRYMNAGDVYTNRTYTGSGVTVGLLEDGIIDVNNSNIAGSNYTIHNQFWVIESAKEHATDMAQIIAGNYGIAKNCHLLSSQISGSFTNEIEWLIDNGADVINMSFGSGSQGTYSDNSAYVDYVVQTYGVFVCVAAGNSDDGNDYVDNPGLAYNALSVGSASGSGGMAQYVCYQTNVGPNKPNLVVCGENIRIPNTTFTTSGTSVACAIMTGTIALLFQKYPYLVGKPGLTMAIINASCEYLAVATSRDANGYHDQAGSGNFLYDRFCQAYPTFSAITTPASESNAQILNRQVVMSAGQTIKVAYFSIVNATGDKDETRFSDIDMRIMCNGQMVVHRTSTIDNVEVIEYTATSSGLHEIQLQKYLSEAGIEEEVYLAYYLS